MTESAGPGRFLSAEAYIFERLDPQPRDPLYFILSDLRLTPERVLKKYDKGTS